MEENKRDQIEEPDALDDLEEVTDEDLRTLAQRATSILEARENERRKEALKRIRTIAKENGLSVSVKTAGRRGHRRKVTNAQKPAKKKAS